MKTGFIILGMTVTLGLSILISYLLWGRLTTPGVLQENLKYDIFKDLITLILSIGGIVIAIAGYFIYLLILEKTKAAAQSAAEEEAHRVSAGVLTHVGLSYWHDFQRTTDSNDLNEAIDVTELAYSRHTEHLDERKHERLICDVKNNLAYYYAKRGSPVDRKTAKVFADYVEERSSKYPDAKETWVDTVEFVRKQYP